MNAESPPQEAVLRFRNCVEALIGTSFGTIGVAVSGGPDSLALLLLAGAAFPGRVAAATVDHGLRAESAGEAAFVGSVCSRIGVAHEVIRPATPITGNLQSAAREARYALLEAWRRRHGHDWLATAHHADDQAETVLMRLNRGSGLAGLAGVRAVNKRVVRPLLDWRRSELVAIVAKAGIEPVDDPSNVDPSFDRARIRKALSQASWIDPAALARSAAVLAEAEAALEWAADRQWTKRVTAAGSALLLDPTGLPPELRRRLVRRILAEFAPQARPRGEEIGRLLEALQEGRTATLAGVKGKGGETWRFEAAPGRRH